MNRHFGYELAVVAIAGTLAIFLFPAVSGPFSVVYGPASALRAAQAWVQFLATLSLLLALCAALVWEYFHFSGFSVSHKIRFSPLSSILRC